MAEPLTIRVYPSAASVSRAVAAAFVDGAKDVLASARYVSVALAGGNTPRETYRVLASRHERALDWRRVMWFWGDERYVPQHDAASNYNAFDEAFLSQVESARANVHPMPTHRRDPRESAAAYERFLRSKAAGRWPRFDLMLLGLGRDGHTASLFPGSIRRDETRLVITTEAPEEPRTRLTMTLPVLNAARRVWFLVTGEDKAAITARVLGAAGADADLPAARVRPESGSLVWWLDAAAADRLPALDAARGRITRYDDDGQAV